MIMKKEFKTFLTLIIAFNLGFTATSCSNEDNYSHGEDRELYQYLNAAEKDVVYRHYLQGGNFMYYQGDDADEKAWKVPLAKEKAVMVPLVYQYIQENLPKGFPLTWKQWKDRISLTMKGVTQ